MRSKFVSILSILVVAASMSAVAAETPKARFSNALSYVGQPKLTLTLSMIDAGGGPKDFSTGKLVGVLAGDKAKAEVEKLTKQYGQDNIQSFLTVFDFVVNDSLRIAGEKKVALPSDPEPSPKDGKALAASLYKAGLGADAKFDVEFMLDGLVSHPIHTQVMDDVDKKYGRKADANYHIVLLQALTDLKALYGL